MRFLSWVRRFGLRRAWDMERELWGDRIAAALLRLAHKLSSEAARDHEQGQQAYLVAKRFVYGEIDATEAKRRFYGIYY